MTSQDSPLGGPLDLPEDAYPKHPHAKPKKRGLKLALIIVGSLVLIGAAGFGAWKFILSKPAADTANSTSTSATSTQGSNNGTSDVPASELTETYTSNTLRISFKYPKSWTVSEANGGVLISSPEFSFETQNNGVVQGNFKIYIRKGAREQDRKYIGTGVAILPSQKLVYSEPLPDQRTETNLSFFGENTDTNFAFFLIAGNYELQKGDTLGPDYGKEPETYIIAGGYSGKALTDDLATYQMSPETFQQTIAYQQAVEILKSLQIK